MLIIDLDPQGNASTGLGIASEDRQYTTYDVILGTKTFSEIIKETKVPGLKIAPSNTDLSSADIDLTGDNKKGAKAEECIGEWF